MQDSIADLPEVASSFQAGKLSTGGRKEVTAPTAPQSTSPTDYVTVGRYTGSFFLKAVPTTFSASKHLRFAVRYVFHRDGARIGDNRKAWDTACRKAGVAKLFHDLRRTRARDMRRAGVPENVCMTILGHCTGSIFTRYDIVDEKDQQEALLKAEQYLRDFSTQQQQQQPIILIHQESASKIS